MKQKSSRIGFLTLTALLLSGAVVSAQCKTHCSSGIVPVPGTGLGAAVGALAGGGCSSSAGMMGAINEMNYDLGCPIQSCPSADIPAVSVKPCEKLAKELVTILNETDSKDTFFVTLNCLACTKAEAEMVVPAIIRNAERLGVSKDLISKDGPSSMEQEMLMKALEQFMKTSRSKTVKKKAVASPVAPEACPCGVCPVGMTLPAGPYPCGGCPGGLTLPSPRYLEHPPQYIPETPPAIPQTAN